MGEPGIGRIRGFCARRATSRLWANRVSGGSGVFARAARHPGYGRTGYWADPGFLRAPRAARRATSRLWANRVLGGSGVFARAARHPGYGGTGYWADPTFLRVPRATRRATSRLWANRVLGGSGVFARAARPCAARHPGYGRTGYWADPGFLRAPRNIPVMGEPGIGWIRGFCARRATSRLWANRVLGGSGVFARAARRAPRDIPVMGEPGIGRIRGFCACRATSRLWGNRVLGRSEVFARAARHAPRDIPVMGEPGIGRIRGFCARRATSRLWAKRRLWRHLRLVYGQARAFRPRISGAWTRPVTAPCNPGQESFSTREVRLRPSFIPKHNAQCPKRYNNKKK